MNSLAKLSLPNLALNNNHSVYPVIGDMETEKLMKQSYKEQLIKAGVAPWKAEQAIKNLTIKELKFIREIWLDWAKVLAENKY